MIESYDFLITFLFLIVIGIKFLNGWRIIRFAKNDFLVTVYLKSRKKSYIFMCKNILLVKKSSATYIIFDAKIPTCWKMNLD